MSGKQRLEAMSSTAIYSRDWIQHCTYDLSARKVVDVFWKVRRSENEAD
jgi:hypothetical protein